MTPKERTGNERKRRGRKRQEGRPGKGSEQKKPPCSAPECGRPAYARGLCQTHHRQRLTTGKVKAIRPYRERLSDTVKFAGLRLTARCAERVQRYAERKGIAKGAAIAGILQQWLEEGCPVPPRTP